MKVETLRSVGYNVEVLWERDSKTVSGQDVRDMIASRDPEYERLVPSATARMVENVELWRRVASRDG